MARRKQFDVDEALDSAMSLFWQQGYERTSLDDLLKHMKIGRASFYNAFDSKHALFMRVLRRYQGQYNQITIIDTLADHSGLAGIEQVFTHVVDSLSNDPNCKGCLIVNSTAETAPNDPKVDEYISEVAQRSEDAFYDALRNAQLADEIDSDMDCRAMARFLMATLRGMRLAGRATNNRRVFEDIAQIALSTL